MTATPSYASGSPDLAVPQPSRRADGRVVAAASATFVALMVVVGLPVYLTASDAPLEIGSLAWLLGAGVLLPVGMAAATRRIPVRRQDAPAVAAVPSDVAVSPTAVDAARDELTGLLAGDAFADILAREAELAVEGGYPIALAVLDVDQLGRTNAELGQQAGDRLLAGIGRLIRLRTRSDDSAFRTGGDEFAIIMPRCTAGKAQSVLRRLLLAALEDGAGEQGRAEWSFSAGISSQPELSNGHLALRRDANAALNRAKRNGRTDVQLFDLYRDLTEEQRRDELALGEVPQQDDDDFTSGEHAVAPIQLRFLGSGRAPSRQPEWVDPRLVIIGLADDPETARVGS